MDRLEETEIEVNEERVLEIAFEINPEDCLAADRHARRRLLKKAIPSWAATLYNSVVFFATLLATMFISGVAGRLRGIESRLLNVALLLYLSVFLVMLLWRKIVLCCASSVSRKPKRFRCGKARMILGRDQFRRIAGKGESLTSLDAVSEVVVLSEIIVIYLDAVASFCVPCLSCLGGGRGVCDPPSGSGALPPLGVVGSSSCVQPKGGSLEVRGSISGRNRGISREGGFRSYIPASCHGNGRRHCVQCPKRHPTCFLPEK